MYLLCRSHMASHHTAGMENAKARRGVTYAADTSLRRGPSCQNLTKPHSVASSKHQYIRPTPNR